MVTELKDSSGNRIDRPRPPLIGVDVVEGRLVGDFGDQGGRHVSYKLDRDGYITLEFQNYELAKRIMARLQDGSMPQLKIELLGEHDAD